VATGFEKAATAAMQVAGTRIGTLQAPRRAAPARFAVRVGVLSPGVRHVCMTCGGAAAGFARRVAALVAVWVATRAATVTAVQDA
jgi:hypothetical protein